MKFQGRPKGVTPKFSLAPLVPHLSGLLGIQVVKADDCIGPEVEKLVASLSEGGVLLENVRFYKEEENEFMASLRRSLFLFFDRKERDSEDEGWEGDGMRGILVFL
ncbi:hypothetical protein K1719_014457 [Acacia pycnantha]|nr:hypothetical protein K1719_014457 [Acacia pycnantha]